VAPLTSVRSLAFNHARNWRSTDPERANFAIIVLYLRYNDLKQTFYNLLASCAQQLIQEQAKVPLVIHEMYRRHYRHDTVSCLEEIVAALTELLTACTRSLIFVDGLDECSEDIRWALIETLKGIGPNVSLFFTARLLETIGEELGDFLHAEMSAHQEDIELYVERQIREKKHLRKMAQRSPGIVGEIKAAVGRTADKMYVQYLEYYVDCRGAELNTGFHLRLSTYSRCPQLQIYLRRGCGHVGANLATFVSHTIYFLFRY
jgi:hypothetical protein